MTEPLNPVEHGKAVAKKPLGTVREVVQLLASPLESLANLIWLAADASASSKDVRLYMRMAEEQMVIVGQIVVAVSKAPD